MFELLFTHPLWAYRTGRLSFASGWPVWVLIASSIAGAVLIAVALSRRRTLETGRLWLIGGMQASLLVLVLCMVWRPVLNVERVRDRENVLAVAIDASASMAYGEGGQSRLQEAVSALQANALSAWRKTFELRLFSYAAQTTSIPTLDAMPPPGPQTRIGDALLQLLQTGASVPLAGIVLISDGAENGGTLSEARLAEIASYGVPIHTVGVGPERNPNDLEIEQLHVPQVAAAAATVTAQIEVRHDGKAATRLRVYDQDRLLAAKDLQLPADSDLSSYSVEIPAGEPGTHDLRFSLDALAGERNVVNNSRSHVLNVPAGKRRILYIDGEPRWEYKFIRRALDGERAVRLTSAVHTTPNKYFRQGVDAPNELTSGFPSRAAELFDYDAVIVGSFDSATLSTAQHQMLRQFVDKRGGSVLLLAGVSGLSAGAWENTELARTLPTHLPDRQPHSFTLRSAHVMPTVYGLESAIARLDEEPKRNSELWKSLPPVADFQALGRLKPGAVVLLDAVTDRSRSPLLVWQRYGRGATYLLGTASTLRWQMLNTPDDQRYEMFWRQMAHALADNTPARTTLTSEHSVYDDERRVTLNAELRDANFDPINDARVDLQVAPENAASYNVPMQPSGDNDGRYVANIDAPSSGLYRIDLTARAGSVDAGSATA